MDKLEEAKMKVLLKLKKMVADKRIGIKDRKYLSANIAREPQVEDLLGDLSLAE